MEVTLQNLTKKFPARGRKNREDVIAVNDFTFEIPDGKLIGLLGPSGCGKSTTLNLISGLLKPTSGRIFFGEDDVTDLPPENRGIGLVFQNYALYPHLTVRQNILFPLQNLKGKDKLPKAVMLEKAQEAAKLVQINDLMERKPGELSGGQQQRVAIARALVKMPRVLLLDEPLSNLDAKLRTAMRAEISRLHKRLQTTFVYVTHDQTEAMTMGDRIVVMKNGIIQQNDTPQTLYDAPCNLFVAGFIGSPQMNFLDAVIAEENGKFVAKTCGSSVTLPERMGREVLGPYVGKTVVLGVRPEDVDAAVGPNYDLDATIEIAELMGAEIHLHLDCQGSKVVVRAPSTYPGRVGDSAKLTLNKEKIHLFDKETEQAIAH